MTLTGALALLCSLIGWMFVFRAFTPNTPLALLVVVLIGSFHYSTFAFRTVEERFCFKPSPLAYSSGPPRPGDERRARGAARCGLCVSRVHGKTYRAYPPKAALIAASLVSIAVGRRISHGIFGGAVGAVTPLVVVYVSFVSGGPTAASQLGPSIALFGSIAFSSLIPWVAGISWPELMTPLFFDLTDLSSSTPTGYLAVIREQVCGLANARAAVPSPTIASVTLSLSAP
jgi:hypothetical protein